MGRLFFLPELQGRRQRSLHGGKTRENTVRSSGKRQPPDWETRRQNSRKRKAREKGSALRVVGLEGGEGSHVIMKEGSESWKGSILLFPIGEMRRISFGGWKGEVDAG